MASARAGSTAGGRCPDPALAAGGVPRGAEVSGGGLEEERRRQAKGSWRWRQAEGSPAGRSPSPRQIWPVGRRRQGRRARGGDVSAGDGAMARRRPTDGATTTSSGRVGLRRHDDILQQGKPPSQANPL
ncbi:Os04g0339300 [Oryza sativa Japonica Group]|uniref:Os04g0339300 protein n=1 Tax=Oryza sativa subsp. japonica TaxID=39947 RepID=A0A0P0W8W9_ORYSJ|nr:Os04g0339300 [Oryza sativa Japonica Group]